MFHLIFFGFKTKAYILYLILLALVFFFSYVLWFFSPHGIRCVQNCFKIHLWITLVFLKLLRRFRIIAWNGFDNFFFFFQIFGLNQPDFRKKVFFAKWSGGFTLHTPLVVQPLKKKLFYVCLLTVMILSAVKFPLFTNFGRGVA